METGFQRLGLGADTPWWHDSSQGAEDGLDASVNALFQGLIPAISNEHGLRRSLPFQLPLTTNISDPFQASATDSGNRDFLIDQTVCKEEVKELFGAVVIPPPFQRSSTEDISSPAQPFPMVDISQPSKQASGTELKARKKRSGQKRKAKPEPRALHPLVENFWTVTRPGEVKCKSCDTSMIGVLSQMNKHLETHDIESPFICGRENCDHTASTEAALKEHLCTAHPDLQKPCLFCNFELAFDRGMQELAEHTRVKHFFNNKKMLPCFECQTFCRDTKNLAIHMRNSHPSDRNPPSLVIALSSIDVTINTTSRNYYIWTASLLNCYYNDQSGLLRANPGFTLEDKKRIEKALDRAKKTS